MAHESFEDPNVAAVINRDFIPIKVDREERPDVDAVYMAACIAMNGSGGWPLTALLTANQLPFWVGTYLPPQQLLSLLEQAANLWRENRNGLQAAGEELTAHLRQTEESLSCIPSKNLVEQAVALYASSFDAQWGGFGQAPKFPTAHNLLFLIRYTEWTGDGRGLEMAQQTMEHMYRGGLFDHVGGGFARYSTDRQWLIPHFEKMLYDNALLAFTYTEAYQCTRRNFYREVARRTLDYVLDELTDPQGGFYCGQDADSDGIEGKYYVFTPAELTQVLSREEAEIFCSRFSMTKKGNFEGKNIPHLIQTLDWEREPAGITAVLRKVSDFRRNRTRLHRDDKVLTSWNGLMLAAMARAGFVLEEPRYIDAAAAAAGFIEGNLVDDRGRLLARWREGEAAHPGKLEDYAFYAWGLLELYSVTFRIEFLDKAHRLAKTLLDLFFDHERGGCYPYASDGEQLITRTKEVYDGAMPSGNAVAAMVFSRLARLTGDGRWRTATDLQLQYLAGAIREYPAGHSFTLLTLLEELWPTSELVCAGDDMPQELFAFLRERPRTGLTVLVKTPENGPALAALAPFTGEYPCPKDGVRYYLCQNSACARPVTTIEDLKHLMVQA